MVTTTITGPNGWIFAAFGQAVVLDALLSASGAAFAPVVDLPFTGVVATFSDANSNGVVSDFQASINWGDGHISNGTIGEQAGTNTWTSAA